MPVSALTGEGVEALLDAVSSLLTADAQTYTFVLPAAQGHKLAWLHANGEVLVEDPAGEGEEGPLIRVQVRLSPRDMGRYARL